MAKFTSIEGLFNQAEQSVGPYTSGNEGSSELIVFQPEQGIDITYKNPLVNVNSTKIVEDRDSRIKLGTFTLNDIGFWEDANFNKSTFQPYLTDDKETTNIPGACETYITTDSNSDVIVYNRSSVDSATYRYSIDALPFVTNPNDGDEIIRVDRYWDKKINSTEHYLATEGKINYYIYPRADSRVGAGNIDLFSPRGLKTADGGKNKFTVYAKGLEETGYYLFKLNWGDGSSIEHTTEPKLLEGTTLLKHTYKKPGFYTISGVVYVSYKNEKINAYEKFETNILLNPSKNYELNLYNYDNFTTIGGISDNSTLVKSAINTIGVNPITKDTSRSSIELIDGVNDYDKLELLNFINKISSDILSEEFFSFYQPYNVEIKNASNSTIHNGFINKKTFDTFKENGLNNFDLATTKIYKGVKPMWEQLGFASDDSDIPNENIYWENIIPNDYTLLNKSGITIEDGNNPLNGSRTPRTPYKEVIINQDDEQVWDNNYYYPNLPKLDIYGNFVEEINIKNLYGVSTAPITDLDEVDDNLIFNLDFDQINTDDIIDKTNFNKLEYVQDFKLSLDRDLRLNIEGLIIPDGIEKNKNEQAF